MVKIITAKELNKQLPSLREQINTAIEHSVRVGNYFALISLYPYQRVVSGMTDGILEDILEEIRQAGFSVRVLDRYPDGIGKSLLIDIEQAIALTIVGSFADDTPEVKKQILEAAKDYEKLTSEDQQFTNQYGDY